MISYGWYPSILFEFIYPFHISCKLFSFNIYAVLLAYYLSIKEVN